eukprot:TRINITY_DN5395_c0_g2_i1.p1 TRINITY_DN5395_c0_g2~~TRINITY_DN5395_c0_g2_i1.p1  ORF type:complete len:214 (+),score=73.00 TRINITY_DN5395_c0_g2_i1:29-670(+)
MFTLVLDAADTIKAFNNAIRDMHRYMIPIFGSGLLVISFICMFLLLKKGDKVEKHLTKVLAVLCLTQMVISIFLLITQTGWQVGFQLGMFAVFGVFASLTAKKDYIFLYGIICLFFMFALPGFMSILGYSDLYSSMDKGSTPASCMAYYGYTDPTDTPGLCYGWISFLRVVVFALLYMQAVQAFLAYYITAENKGMHPALADNSGTDYGSIKD